MPKIMKNLAADFKKNQGKTRGDQSADGQLRGGVTSRRQP
jgi:hypothetical protein